MKSGKVSRWWCVPLVLGAIGVFVLLVYFQMYGGPGVLRLVAWIAFVAVVIMAWNIYRKRSLF